MIHVCMAHRLLLALLLLALASCKGATNGKPPVDHPIYEHQPPEDLTEAEDEEVEEEEPEEEEGGAEDAQ
jgi:hypothetical protein